MKKDMSNTNPWKTSWELMNARASWFLERSADLKPSLVVDGLMTYGPPRLRIWGDAGGFGCELEPTSLTVFDPFHDISSKPIVREAVWHRTSDLRRLHAMGEDKEKEVALEPTIAVRDADIPSDQFKAILLAGRDHFVPLVWMDEMKEVTCDVGSVGFEFFSRDQPPAVLRLVWSSDTPEQWNPVKEWVARLRDFLEYCLKNSK